MNFSVINFCLFVLSFINWTKKSHTVNKLFLMTILLMIKSFNTVSVQLYILTSSGLSLYSWKIICTNPFRTCSSLAAFCWESVSQSWTNCSANGLLSLFTRKILTVLIHHPSVKIAYTFGVIILHWKSWLPGYSPFC